MIVLLPGLGFDHRIFQHLDFGGQEVRYLDWIDPVGKESIADYSKRLAHPLLKTPEGITLIGHSFGGLVAQEIAHWLPIKQIILISSIRSREEMPLFFRLVRPLGLHNFFTRWLALTTFPLWAKSNDYVTPESQQLFVDMVKQQSNTYLKWALRTLSMWEKPPLPDSIPIFQLHGSQDRTFPIKKLNNPDQIMEGAGHFMVFNEPQQVNQWLFPLLKT